VGKRGQKRTASKKMVAHKKKMKGGGRKIKLGTGIEEQLVSWIKLSREMRI
jgi:hypothetical protein